MVELTSTSPEQTGAIAAYIGQMLRKGDILCLQGDLGAGKTAFTQGLAKGMGIEDYVTSPTFTIINEYHGPIPLYHFDVYRLTHADELFDIGYEEYFYGDGVVVVEWPERIIELLPEEKLWIRITHGSGENTRVFHIKGWGKRYEELEEAIKSVSPGN